MPNWCNNSITLRHKDPAMIDRAFKALTDARLLQEFVPCPQPLLDTMAGSFGDADSQRELEERQAKNLDTYGAKDWYDWNVANWGTKWDVGGSDGVIDRVDPNTLQASFDSAWAPPCAAYERLAALGFDITAYYDECGMAFCGKVTANENEFFDDYYEYGSETSETVREAVGPELDDYWGLTERFSEWEADREQELVDELDDIAELEREGLLPPHTD